MNVPEYLCVRDRRVEVRWWPSSVAEPPLVLLHEGLGSVTTWREFPEELAARTRRSVMAYSRFGHGRSDPPPRPHDIWFMHEEARLLPGILTAAGIERALLLGHSDGGSIALITAAEQPARVAGLILEAPHVFVEDLSIRSIEQTTHAFATGDLRSRLARHHADVDLAFRGWSDVWLDPAFRAWNLEAFAAHIDCPALLIQGEDDEYGTLRQIERIEQLTRSSVRRLVLPACGHAPHRDQRERVLEAISRFLTEEISPS